MSSIPKVIIEIKLTEKIKGEVGLFATQDIKEGTVVAPSSEYRSEFHLWQELEELDQVTKKKVMDFCLGEEKGFYIPKNYHRKVEPCGVNDKVL